MQNATFGLFAAARLFREICRLHIGWIDVCGKPHSVHQLHNSTGIREIHPLDPQPNRHSMLYIYIGYVRLGLRSVAWGSIGHVIQKEAGMMSGRMLAGRQPILGYTGYL